MIELNQENLMTILGLSSAGAFTGGVIGLMMERIGKRGQISEGVMSEARTLIGSLEQFREGSGATQTGFSQILNLLSPNDDEAHDEISVDLPTGLDDQTKDESCSVLPSDASEEAHDEASGDNHFAGKLVAAVMAIPALPDLPDFSRNFELLQDNEMLGAVLKQLKNVDTSGVNSMLEEFKSLISNTLKTNLDKANSQGLDFILEPESMETLKRSAGEFVKTVGGINKNLDSIIGKVTELIK